LCLELWFIALYWNTFGTREFSTLVKFPNLFLHYKLQIKFIVAINWQKYQCIIYYKHVFFEFSIAAKLGKGRHTTHYYFKRLKVLPQSSGFSWWRGGGCNDRWHNPMSSPFLGWAPTGMNSCTINSNFVIQLLLYYRIYISWEALYNVVTVP